MKINYQKVLEETLSSLADGLHKPRLLLHACCAPCASYVLQYLAPYFAIDIFFYNPNIFPPEEYHRRLEELIRLCDEANFGQDINILESPFVPDDFFAAAKGLENAPEGGPRCTECFRLRLKHAAQMARDTGADYFTTTLTISPHKNASLLNELGQQLALAYGVPYLCSDFKKKEGYKRSIALSQQYGLYRQDYCGCIFSQEEARKRTEAASPTPPPQ